MFVLLNNQQGGFTQAPANFGPLSYEPILADLNGDGKLDLVLSYTGLRSGGNALGASIYLGDGAGGFTFSETLAAISIRSLNFVADVNGDGIPDVCVL